MTEARADTALAWTLGVLAAVSLVVGLYAFIWPHSFYDHVLGVDRLPPYNQHLLTDVGGFYLGFAVLFAWAAAERGRALVLATCAAWIVVQALHLAYHVTHLEHFSVATAVAQTVLLAAAPAVAVAALLGARASGRRARARPTRSLSCDLPRRPSSRARLRWGRERAGAGHYGRGGAPRRPHLGRWCARTSDPPTEPPTQSTADEPLGRLRDAVARREWCALGLADEADRQADDAVDVDVDDAIDAGDAG
jgi:hypothetical protein